MRQVDVIIVGGGIVGLATAYHLTRVYPGRKVLVLEKESRVASHQSGHNSGVLHSGVYYKPGSLKAKNCVEGKRRMEEFCREEGLDFEICGKVIVAVSEVELPRLKQILERGQANGVRCEWIDRDRLGELEPHTAGIAAVHVPDAGIVDFAQVCERMAERIVEQGGSVVCDARVTMIDVEDSAVFVKSTAGDFVGGYLVNCAGLQCDRITRLAGQRPQAKIVPFRGEFYELDESARHLCRGLIYPVPDPKFPFLGVHLTKTVDGRVECGPNAVFALAREGYHKTDINLRDLAEWLAYPGFFRMSMKYWKTGIAEAWRSFSKAAFTRAIQRLVPEIEARHLRRAASGVRAQAVDRDGQLVDDFLIQRPSHRILHVENAPSPAATSALNIGRLIADELK